MNYFAQRCIVILFGTLLVFGFLVPFSPLYAQVPSILHYQGRLLNSNGDLLGNSGTDHCFQFSFYNDETVGVPDTKLWPTGTPAEMTISVRNGVFTAGIGDVDAGGDILDFDFQSTSSLFLNIAVATVAGGACGGADEVYETLSPRQPILSSSYALTSGNVFGAGRSSIGTTTPHDEAVLTVEATTTSSVPLIIRRFTSQIADLFRIVTETGAALLTFTAGGDLGIGTSTPAAKLAVGGGNFYVDGNITGSSLTATGTLSVTGVATSTFTGGIDVLAINQTGSATSTFNQGINLANGCFAINGTCIGGSGIGTFLELTDTPSSYTNNAVLYANGTSDLTQSADFVFNGTNLGIGSTTPGVKLSVGGAAYIGGNLTATGTLNLTAGTLQIAGTDIITTGRRVRATAGTAALPSLSFNTDQDIGLFLGGTNILGFSTNGIERARIGANGRVGIGTTSPSARLTASSTSVVTAIFDQNGSNDIFQLKDGGNLVFTVRDGGSVGIGTSSPTEQLGIANRLYVGGTGTSTFENNLHVRGTLQTGSGSLFLGDDFISANGALSISSGAGSDVAITTSAGGNFIVNNDTFVVDSTTGNVGIGTSSPGTAFAVNGEILAGVITATTTQTSIFTGDITTDLITVSSTTATSTFAQGLSISSGCLEVNGTCITTDAQTLDGVDSAQFLRSDISDNVTAGTLTIDSPATFRVDGATILTNATATNATTTNNFYIGNLLTVAGTSIFDGSTLGVGTSSPSTNLSISGNAYVTNGLGIGTVRTSAGLSIASVTSCGGSTALQTDSGGGVFCGAIASLGIDTAGGWTTDSIGNVNLATSSDVVGIGATTTSYAKLSIISGHQATTTLALVPFLGQNANILEIYDTAGTLASVFTPGHRLGIGTTSPSELLSVAGGAYIAGNFTATGTLLVDGSGTFNGGLISESTASTSDLIISNTISGAGLVDCDISTAKLTWDLATEQFGCGTVPTQAVIDAYDNAGGVSIGTTETVLNVDTPRRIDDVYTLESDDEITFEEDGLYKIVAHITAVVTSGGGNNQERLTFRGYASTSVSGFVAVDGAECEDAVRPTPSAGSCTIAWIEQYSLGDQVRFTHQLGGTTVAATTRADGSGVVITKLDGSAEAGGGGDLTGGGNSGEVTFWQNSNTLQGDASFIWDSSNGRLGIGTSTPYASLSVVGEVVGALFTATTTATSTFSGGLDVLAINQTGSATSTFAQGIDLASGCFAVNGTCLSGGGASSFGSLTDVTLTAPAFGELVRFDGSDWVNVATSTLGIALSDTTGTLVVTRGGTGSTSPSGFLYGPNDGTLISSTTIAQNFIDDALLRDAEIDQFSELNALVSDKTLVNEEDTAIFDSVITFALGLLSQASSTIDGNLVVTGNATVTNATTTGDLNVGNLFTVTGVGTSTFANGVTLSNGCFAVGGTCIDLNADDLTDNNLADLSDVGAASTLGSLLYYDGADWDDIATSALQISITDTTGTLPVARGGTGTTTITENYLLIGGAANTITDIATSSLGLVTTDIIEGTNLYYTDELVDTRIIASTTIVNLDCNTGQVAKADGLGAWNCDTDVAGGAGGSGLWATSTGSDLQHPTDTGRTVVIGAGATSTTGNILEVVGSTLFDNITVDGVITVTGLGDFSYASSTGFSSYDSFYIGRNSTTTLRADGGTSTFTNGIDVATGCVSVAGVCFVSATDITLNDINDVVAPSPSNGDLFSYNGSNWVNIATSTLGIALSDTAGTLTVSRGGTGITSVTNNELLIGGAGNTITQVATSSLGLITTDITEGTNLYYTDSRVDARIIASSTILNNNTESALESFLSGVTNVFTNNDGALTDDNLSNDTVSTLSDVDTTGAAVGNTLTFNGSSWVDTATSALAIALSDTVGTLSVDRGGTGATSLTSGQLLVGNDTGAITASSGPQVTFINTTDGAATSTFAGGLDVLAINQTGAATSTFNQGIDLADGCFAINGTCVGGGAGATLYTELTDTPSALTANAIQFANAAGSDLIQSTSLTFDGSTFTIPRIVSTSTATSTFAGNIDIAGNASTSNLYITDRLVGAGLSSCNASSSKLVYDATTEQFGCGDDQGAEQVVDAYDNAGGVSIGTTETVLNVDTTRRIDDAYTLESDDEITFEEDGLYHIVAHITAVVTSGGGNNQERLTFRGYASTSVSGFVAVDGAECEDMVRPPPSAGSCTIAWIEQYSLGDQVRFTHQLGGTSVTPTTRADGSGVVITKLSDSGADVAELYQTDDVTISAGDIISVHETIKAGVQKSDKQYDNATIGIVSTRPGLILGGGEVAGQSITSLVVVALSGRVPTKVSIENGPIQAGDPITTSSSEGVGMKAIKPGRVIGIALEDYTEEDAVMDADTEVTGTIAVFLNPSWYSGDPTRFADWFNLEDAVLANGETEEDLSGIRLVVFKVLESFGFVVERGVAVLEKVLADTVIVRNADVRKAVIESLEVENLAVNNAFQMVDQASGRTYCMVLEDGVLTPKEGVCDSFIESDDSSVALEDKKVEDGEFAIQSDGPMITVLGNNPAEIEVGSTYADLGALIADVADQNLGIHTIVNDVEMRDVQIDTSIPGEHTIEYYAIDQDGNRGFATRMVFVGTGESTSADDAIVDGEVEPVVEEIISELLEEEVQPAVIEIEEIAEEVIEEIVAEVVLEEEMVEETLVIEDSIEDAVSLVEDATVLEEIPLEEAIVDEVAQDNSTNNEGV